MSRIPRVSFITSHLLSSSCLDNGYILYNQAMQQKTKFITFLIILIQVVMLSFSSSMAFATSHEPPVDEEPAPPGFGCGEEGGEDCQTANLCEGDGADCSGADFVCDEAVSNADSENIVCQFLRIVNFLSIGVAFVATITVAASGIQYMGARGDPNKTAAAIQRMVQVGIGIAMYVFGWAFLNWLIPGGAV